MEPPGLYHGQAKLAGSYWVLPGYNERIAHHLSFSFSPQPLTPRIKKETPDDRRRAFLYGEELVPKTMKGKRHLPANDKTERKKVASEAGNITHHPMVYT
ncbi:MAG: hypothetical protein ACFCD0_09320 [Gemmataceae bacterium]